MRLLTILCLLVTSFVFAEPTVVGPGVKVKNGRVISLAVNGFTDAELGTASVVVSPQDGIMQLLAAKSWGGNAVILFQAEPTADTHYTVTVSINGWRQPFDAGIQAARNARIAQNYITVLDQAIKPIQDSYPVKNASAIVEVAGSVPPTPPVPPTPVPPVPPVVSGKRILVILHETTDTTKTWSDLWVRLRHPSLEFTKYAKEKGHSLDILDKDLAPKWAALSQGKKLPVLIQVDLQSFAVLSVDEFDSTTTPGALLALVKSKGG